MSLRRTHSPADRTPSPAFAQSVERNPVAKFLARRLVAEVCPVRNVLSLRSGDPINIALNVMADAGVQSAPVVNQHGGVVGILSVLDVVRHLAAAVPDAAAATEDQLRAVDLASTSAEGLLRELGPPPEPAPVFDAQPALFLLDVLKAAPRVVVFSEVFGEAPGDRGSHVEMSRVCSRADLLRLVNASREDPLLRPVLQASLQDSGYRPGRVVSVPQDATVLQAAAAMARGGLSAVALLDSNGRLAGALTSRDLRGLRGAPESLRDLLLPCAVYLASRGGSGAGGLAEVVRVSPGDPFGKAVALMVSHGLHEVWVCEGGFAQGVVTAADAVAWLAAARAAGAFSREIRLQGVAFRLPGPLNVRVLACDNLPAGTAAPTVECVVGRTGPRFTTRAGPSGPSPSWRDEGADLQLTEEFLGNNLNFTVRDGDEVLGYVRVPVKWVVSAFGTRAPAVVTFRDTYRLEDADQGDLELEFLWKGH